MEVKVIREQPPPRRRDQSPLRKARWPDKVQQEKQWFATAYLKPNDIHNADRVDNIEEFQHLIWETPANTLISKYGHTPNEMAILCGEGSSGWLLSSHITWICNKLNRSQSEALNLVLNFSSPEDLKRLKDKMGQTVKYVNFVVNVGKNVDGTVFMSSEKCSGNHWVLVSVDISSPDDPRVLYCDSLGWDCPTNFVNHLSDFVQVCGINLYRLVFMHKHTTSGHSQCTSDCKNYPLQTCTNVCGLVAVMCTVVSALDAKLFKEFTGPCSDNKVFLHEPTKYEKYMRRVLIYWFTVGNIDPSLLQQKCPITQTSETDPTYNLSSSSTLNRKRKASNPSQSQSKYTLVGLLPVNNNNFQAIERALETQAGKPTLLTKVSLLPKCTKVVSLIPGNRNNAQAGSSTLATPHKQSESKCTKVVTLIPGNRNNAQAGSSTLTTPYKQSESKCTKVVTLIPGNRNNAQAGSSTLTTPYKQSQSKCTKVVSLLPGNRNNGQAGSSTLTTPYKQSESKCTKVVSLIPGNRNNGQAGSSTLTTPYKQSQSKCTKVVSLLPGNRNNARVVEATKQTPASDSILTPLFKQKCINVTPIPDKSNNARRVIEATKESEDTVLITEPSDTNEDNLSKKELPCQWCNRRFKTPGGRIKHQKKEHMTAYMAHLHTSPHASACKCVLCPFVCNSVQGLIAHYNNGHNKAFTVNTKMFKNKEEFFLWKSEIEKTTSTRYIRHRRLQKKVDSLVYKYFCNRSGKKILVGRLRKRKTNKVGNYCTSYIRATENNIDSTFHVTYCLDHCGHSLHLPHLNYISRAFRERIAKKLASGLEPESIFDLIREKISSVDRDNLLTKKDLHDINNQFDISQSQKHPEDECSVDLWVKQFENGENNPVVFYKPQNSQHNILQVNDFLLCVQTKFQKEMMLKYGSSIICVDSTHGTDQYDFSLVSLMVLDDCQEAIPVAWAITNSERYEILEIFMSEIRKSCGQDIKTKIFMSDMADDFYKSWCASFSQPYNKLCCSWHNIDQSWRININYHLNDEESRCHTYALLKLLQNEKDKEIFGKMLLEFLSSLKTNKFESKNFYSYFIENYVNDNKVMLWAACCQLDTVANTNVCAEAFHDVLKSIDFSWKQNRRVDNLLLILIKMSRDKMIEQIIKHEKGNITHHMTEMRDMHKKAEGIMGIKKLCDSGWIVPSSSLTEMTYNVHAVSSASCTCELACQSCSVCVHMYTCTCTDYLIKSLSCKHIHAVHMTRNNESPSVEMEESGRSDNSESLESMAHQDEPDACDDIGRLKTACFRKLNKIIELASSSNNSTVLRAVLDSLQNTYTMACGLEKLDSSRRK